MFPFCRDGRVRCGSEPEKRPGWRRRDLRSLAMAWKDSAPAALTSAVSGRADRHSPAPTNGNWRRVLPSNQTRKTATQTMSELSPELVGKVAHLARLKVTDTERERLS